MRLLKIIPTRWLTFGSARQAWLYFFIILLVLGIFFRFVNLDRKVYWHDEVYTSLRIAGYTRNEVVQQVFDGRVIGIEDLQKYQRLNPEKGITDTIEALMGNAEHPPLYYLMARLWAQWLGDSVTVRRSLSAWISLLAFPSIYWLCWELFQSPRVGWIAIAFMSISPFHVLYAQEAREYSLWTVTILLSSAALVRAMRLNTKFSWGIYAATLALGFYSCLLFVLVAVEHGIYVLVIECCQWSKRLSAFILAILAGVITFSPWLLVIITNFFHLQRATAWMTVNPPLEFLVKIWGLHVSCIFVDFGFDLDHPVTYLFPWVLLILMGYSIYFICRQTPQRIWLFIVTMIIVTPLALILPDLMLGGQRSTVSRYLIPGFLGIQLAVSYGFAHHIFSGRLYHIKIWQVILGILFAGGIVSCIISSQAETWWNKITSYQNPQMASIINQANRPLVISNASDINPGNVISLSYLLNPKVQFQLVVDPKIPKIADNFSDVFLYYPSKTLQQGLKQNYKVKIKPIEPAGTLPLGKVEKL